MQLYSENENYKLYNGSMLDMLEVIEPNSIDSIITDPPYELNFMGKGWDNSGIAFQPDTWNKCYEVLKPGGYLLAFGGSRTFHRIACAIEDAGFEIRDTIMWLYGSGFPKSMALDKSLEAKIATGSGNKKDFYKCNGILEESKGKGYTSMKKTNVEQDFRDTNYQSKGQIQLEATTELAKKYKGWGTALKPSFEPIIVARKPFKGSLVYNVIEYSVGGINIDECRVAFNGDKWNTQKSGISNRAYQSEETTTAGGVCEANENGRFPANTILTYDETDFDEVCGGFPNTKGNGHFPKNNKNGSSIFNTNNLEQEEKYLSDSGSASRYFYCAKASKKDRDEGLDEFELKGAKELLNREENSDGASWNGKYSSGNAYAGAGCPKKNTHPTVKPTELMQYLVRLVSPDGATILDCFNGSGSTGKAVMYENKERNKNYKYIGIELTEEYLPIAKARIEYVCNLEEEKNPQMTIFDCMGED